MIDLDRYWTIGLRQVDGWVEEGLLEFLRTIGRFQTDSGITGNIAEIGVFHGRFLIALAHLGRPGEVCVAIDIFSRQEANVDGSGVGDGERLRQNLEAYAPSELRYQFVQADSLALGAQQRGEIGSKLGPFRLFSVDGGHTVAHAANDLLFAQDVLSPGGVILVDDYYNRHWPGVTEGVTRCFLLHTPRVAPFLYVHNKLFLTSIAYHERYLKVLSAQFRDRQWFKIVTMFGFEVVVI